MILVAPKTKQAQPGKAEPARSSQQQMEPQEPAYGNYIAYPRSATPRCKA
jgi:hypothetical protein